jgi:NAD(P)H-dependent FMN reductase
MAVAGSLNQNSVTRAVLIHMADRLRALECEVDLLDFVAEPLALYNPDSSHVSPYYAALQARVETADVYLLGTPDYHGSVSSALKNFLDHFWKEFAGKLFASIVSSYEKGLTVTDQIRTVARQCYAWSLPYGVAFTDKEDVREGKIVSEAFEKRLDMMAHDIRMYGQLLANQRRADLAGSAPGFLARYRKK